jgi:hypothetical protein
MMAETDPPKRLQQTHTALMEPLPETRKTKTGLLLAEAEETMEQMCCLEDSALPALVSAAEYAASDDSMIRHEHTRTSVTPLRSDPAALPQPQEGRRRSPRERPKPVQRFDHAAEQAREKAATTKQLLKKKQKQKKTAACCRAWRPRVVSPCTCCPPSEGEEEYGEDEIFRVDCLVRKKKTHGSWLWLVKWNGYSSKDNTWEPEENLSQDLIEDFAKRTPLLCRFCERKCVCAAGRKSHEKAHQALELNPGAKSRRLKAGRGGAKGEGGESRKAPVAHGRLAEAASNVVQLRDKFTEITPQGCKTKRIVSGRAARDEELVGQVLVLLGSSNADGSGMSVDVRGGSGEEDLDGDESSASLEL